MHLFRFSLKASFLLTIVVSTCLASCGELQVGLLDLEDQAPEPTASMVVEEGSPTPAIGITEPPIPAHRAYGLVFTNKDGTWWINFQGQLEHLIDKQHAVFSSDRKWLVYVDSAPGDLMSDLWVMEMSTGTRSNVTNTPERSEALPVWVPGQAGAIVFGSDTEGGFENSQYPTLLEIDSRAYQILDPETGGSVAYLPMARRLSMAGMKVWPCC